MYIAVYLSTRLFTNASCIFVHYELIFTNYRNLLYMQVFHICLQIAPEVIVTQEPEPKKLKLIDCAQRSCCCHCHEVTVASVGTQFPEQPLHSTPLKASRQLPVFSSPGEAASMLTDDNIDVSAIDSGDPSYNPTEESAITDGDVTDIDDSENISVVSDRKFIVFESCLKQLLRFCCKCGAVVVHTETFVRGSMLGAKLKCMNGCEVIWHSQTLLRKMPAGNLLIAGAILFTGGQFTKFAEFAACLNMQMISKTTFFSIQNTYLHPVVEAEYSLQQTALLSAVADDQVFLCGDGQCDSPGHSAKYLTYTLIDEASQYILASKVICVAEVSNSNAMELEGLKRSLSLVEDHRIKVIGIATDRHPQISSFMKHERGELLHQFDIFHTAKSLTKSLWGACKKKGHEEIQSWITSIIHHLWWSCATCDGNEMVCKLTAWLNRVKHFR